MAKRVSVELVDDLDGTAITNGEGGTIVFSLERRSYEIDLSDANQVKLREALAPFIGAGRVVSSSAPRARAAASGTHDLAAVRAWARENGHTVSDRGRVPASVLEAYAASH
ncbi:MAG: Lsr2 family protein [Microbacterium sp.]